jgi:biopolymer transport protein ExbB
MLEWIITGGWALWIITGCSVIALGITFERWRTLRTADKNCESLLGQLFGLIEQGKVKEAIDLCAKTPGPVAETVGTGLRKLVFLERIGKKPEEIEEGIVAAMEDHGGYVVDYLERNLTALATVASLAPILGMMGTVVGMIHAFISSADAGTMTPDVVARGIGEALLCTAGGLIVAALATVEYNYFTTRVNRFVLRVQAAGTRLIEQILEAQANSALNLAATARNRDAAVPVTTP